MTAARGLDHPDQDANDKRERDRHAAKPQRDRECVAQDLRNWARRLKTFAEVAAEHSTQPPCILHRDWRIEPELASQSSRIGWRCGWWHEQRRGIARRESRQSEAHGNDDPQQRNRRRDATKQRDGVHTGMMNRTSREARGSRLDAC
jgi:hypothetical protein